MNSTTTPTASSAAASSSSRRNRRAMRQQQQQPPPASSPDSVGSGGGGTATTAAEAARAARRNRIAGTGIPTSPRVSSADGVSSATSSGAGGGGAAGGGGVKKQSSGSGSGNRIGGSPSAAEVAAAFEDLGMPSMNGTGNSKGSAKQNGHGINGTSGTASSRDRTSAGTSTRSGSVRRSGNTILSSGAASGSNAANAAAGPGTASTSTRAAMPSPQDVADEFVGRRRLQQQRAFQRQQQQQEEGPAGMHVVTMSNTQNANVNANAARNNGLREATTSPLRSRNTAAVKNYVAASASTSTSMKANTTTPTRYTMVESPSKTPSTSNRKQSLRVDTHTSARSGGASGTTAAPHSAASPDTQLGSVNSSELGSLASPAAASTFADSLAYSQNTSKSGSGFGMGSGGLGDDVLSGQATNDIPATTTAAKMMSNGGSIGVASTGDEEWTKSDAVRQNGSARPQSQPRLHMRTGTQSTANTFTATGSTLTAESVDDNFDDGTHGGGSITSRYDDLSKLSSRYNRPDRVMAPVDERPQVANPNGTSRSFDSYENKSHATHATHATAITYGQHDTNGAAGGGVGASAAAANGGGSAKRDGTSIDVVTQSFSPTHQGNTYPSSQASVGAASGGRPIGGGTFDDEDTNTVGSQLTDDRSWSRSVNLRQQHLRAQGRDYDDDADSRGSRRRRKSGKKGGKESGGGEGDMTGWALNADDMNHFREQVDQPQVKAALGASAAVVAGAAIFGPAGVLLGAAAVGLGVGVMQMPEDQREQMKEKATAAAQQTFESAQIAADAMGTTCATACVESGVAEKIDPKFAKFVEDGAHNGCGTTIAATDLVQHNPCAPMEGDILSPLDGDSVVGDAAATSKNGPNTVQSNGANESGAEDSGSENQMPKRRRKVACMRKGRIVPLGQIHSLDPTRQPKAWLDVMASANTSRDEKDEAMEELSIFIKDKYTAHALLDEGILDSLLYIIACFFRNQGSTILRDSPDGIMPMSVRSDPDFLHAKKAANCCVNLGKAHCAIVHTEVDDLLMSAYSNGAVPIERQLAQMLHEVPHHTSLPTTPANKQSAEGGDVTPSSEVVFTLTELSLQHAERLSMSILALSQGRIAL